MNEPVLPGGRTSLPSRAIPWPVWALLAAAIVHLGVQIAPSSYQVFGPYFLVDGRMVVGWVQSITPFLLAATVVLAADRWPTGRRALLGAAAALAVVGALRLGLDAWWAIWETAPGPLPGSWRPMAWTGAEVAEPTAYALMAAGLWASRSVRRGSPVRAASTIAIGLTGLLATGAGLWVVAITLGLRGSWVGAQTATFTAAGFAALAAVAIAAVLVVRPSDPRPEVLVATGAVVTMIASAWTWSYPQIAPEPGRAEQSVVWAFTVPSIAILIGTLAMIGGFGLAAVALRRGTGERKA